MVEIGNCANKSSELDFFSLTMEKRNERKRLSENDRYRSSRSERKKMKTSPRKCPLFPIIGLRIFAASRKKTPQAKKAVLIIKTDQRRPFSQDKIWWKYVTRKWLTCIIYGKSSRGSVITPVMLLCPYGFLYCRLKWTALLEGSI